MNQTNDLRGPELSRVIGMVTCVKWISLPDIWECPGCGRGKRQILVDFYHNKPSVQKIPNLVFYNKDPMALQLKALAEASGVPERTTDLFRVFGVTIDTQICHRCSGRKISDMRSKLPAKSLFAFTDVFNFSAREIRTYHNTLAVSGQRAANATLPEAFEITAARIALIRGFAQILMQVAASSTSESYAQRVKTIVRGAADGNPRIVARPSLPDIRVDPSDVVAEIGYLKKPGSREDYLRQSDQLHRIAKGSTDILSFFSLCAEEDIFVNFEITSGGFLEKLTYWIGGREIGSDLVALTPIHLEQMGLPYKADLHWEEIVKRVEAAEESQAGGL